MSKEYHTIKKISNPDYKVDIRINQTKDKRYLFSPQPRRAKNCAKGRR